MDFDSHQFNHIISSYDNPIKYILENTDIINSVCVHDEHKLDIIFNSGLWNLDSGSYRDGLIQLVTGLLYELMMCNSIDGIMYLCKYHPMKRSIWRLGLQRLVILLYDENLLDLLFEHQWILEVDASFKDTGGFYGCTPNTSFVYDIRLDSKKICEVIRFIITHYESFNIGYIWAHIKRICFHNDSTEIIPVLKSCVHLPLVSNHIIDIYLGAEDEIQKSILPIIEEIIVCGTFKPSAFYASVIVTETATPILELFVKYDINIKELISDPNYESNPRQTKIARS